MRRRTSTLIYYSTMGSVLRFVDRPIYSTMDIVLRFFDRSIYGTTDTVLRFVDRPIYNTMDTVLRFIDSIAAIKQNPRNFFAATFLVSDLPYSCVDL